MNLLIGDEARRLVPDEIFLLEGLPLHLGFGKDRILKLINYDFYVD